jgi:hypothetical protein
MELGTAISRSIVPEGAPWSFNFAEHVMSIGGRKLHTDAQASAHVAYDKSLKDIVRVEL